MRGRIRPGTFCGIDHGCFFRWPNMPKEYQQENFSPDMVFTMEPQGDWLVCYTDNYGGNIKGRSGKYGNGSVDISLKVARKTPNSQADGHP